MAVSYERGAPVCASLVLADYSRVDRLGLRNKPVNFDAEKRPGTPLADGEYYMKRELNQNLSSNEVHFTNYLISLVENMLCSKIHCHKYFDSIILDTWNRDLRV